MANDGPSDAATLTVSDTVPAQFTVTNVTSPVGSCGFAGQVVTCTRPTLLNAATWTITVSVTTTVAAPGGTFTNTATVSAATADPVPANNSASQPTTISVSADLAVTKTDGVASVVAGTSTNYTITLTNNGPSAVAAGVVVSDPIPAGTVGSETEPNCAIAASTFTCTTTAVLASGASVVYHLILAVPANYAPATVVNTATMTSSPATDPTPANNSATDTDTVTKSADLSIAKTDGVASVVAGSVDHRTRSPSRTTVRRTSPRAWWSPTRSPRARSDRSPSPIARSPPGRSRARPRRPIASGGSVAYQLTLAVAASYAPANLSNTASISSTPAADPNGANNAATDIDSVNGTADLSIVKIDSADPVVPGQAFTYTLTVTNNGPSDASTVQVSDTVPAQFTVTNVTSPSGACGNVGNAVTCTRPTLVAAASWVITVSVTANPGAPAGTYTNTATVSAITSDPVAGNNSGSQDTEILPSADLSIVKIDSADPVNPNTSFNYIITVTNNGPSDADNLLVTDPIPGAGFFTINSVVASTGSCGFFGSDVTCTVASLPTGATWTITVSVHLILSTPGGLYTNTAHVTSATFDPVLGNNDGSQSTIVLPAADMVITKDDGVASVVAGSSTTYTITLRNDGPSTEDPGVVVSDPIPAGTTGSTLDPDCTVSAGTFMCTTSAQIDPFDFVTYHLTLDVPPDFAPATLVNTATIMSTPIAETDPSDNSSTDTDTVVIQGDLALTKTDSVATVVAGTSTTYTITATNSGPSQIPAGVVLSDPIPAGTIASESEPNCSIAAGTFTCTTSTPMAVGAIVSYQLTLAVAPDYAPPTLVNTASVTSSPAVDTNPANDTATDSDLVTTSADLAVTKTDGVGTVTAGTSTTYTITITNNGPSTVPAGVVLSDPIPAGTNGSESEADCAIAAATFTCTTSAPIAPGSSRTYQLTLAVPPASLIVTIVNTVSITSAPVADPDASNDSATDTDAVDRSGDLSITKTDGVASVITGTSTTYTITLTNLGPSTEPAGVVIDDPIPAATTPSESAADCDIVAGTFTCTTSAALAPGASVSYQLTLAIPADSVLASLVNTATITTFPITDPNAANNAATDTDTVTTSADLSVTKTDSADPISPGDVLSYVITVTNNGPSDAQNLQVTDTLPAFGSFAITGIVTNAGSCIDVGTLVTCTLGTLPAAGTWTITISVLLDPATPGGLYTDTAQVTSATPDPVPGNDSDAESTIVLPAVDMVITKSDGVASVAAGTSTTYAITLTNGGPSTALPGIVVSDPIPAGTTGSTLDPDCAVAAGTFSCTTSSPIAPFGVVTYHLTLAVPPGYASATVANTATITFNPIAETDPSDDSATDVDAVTFSADLAITKTDLADPVLAGNNVTYAITVTNLGPSDATGVVVTDSLPGSVTFVSAIPSQGSCAPAAGVVSCPLGVVPFGATATISIVVTTTIDGPITDTATVSATTADPVPANDTDSETTTVTPAADLRIAKTDGVASVTAGTSTTYTITVTNDGPSVEPAGVVITDAIPAGTNGSESDAACSIVLTTFTCTTPAPLGSGASVSYQLTLAIPAAYAPATVSNTATIASTPIVDPNAANDSATDVDAVGVSADLSITKTDAVDPVALGDNVVYTITVTNNGPSDAAGVVVTDALPGFTNFVSAFPSQGSCSQNAGIVTCPLGSMVAGSVASITVVAATTVAAVITNLATVTATTPDPIPANNDASENTTVTSTADLSIAKTDGVLVVAAGTSTTYTITLTNNGPSVEPTGIVVSDPIPAGTNASESEADCSIAAAVFTCTTTSSLTVGTSISYQLTLAITPGYVLPTLTNAASITSSPLVDPDASNNAATDVDSVSVLADVSIIKTDGVTVVRPGMSSTYTITLTNNGPSDVPAGIVVTDQIPPGTVASENEADCALTATTFTCTTTATLAAGTSVVHHLTLAIDAAYLAATLVNTATITTSPVPDPNPANDTSSDADTVTPLAADLSIVKTDSADPVLPGDSFSYTIVVTNAGPDDARDIALTDSIPGVLTVSAVTSSGTGTCLTTGQTIVCGIDLLAAAATWTVTVQVGVPLETSSGTVTNTATVSGTGDTDLTNDSASQTTTIGEIVGSADLTVTKRVDDASPQEGDTLTYIVTVANGGPDDATRVEVTDALPAGLTFVSAIATQGSYKASSGVWSVGALAVGETAGLEIRAEVDDGTAGTTITNRTLVSAVDQGDLAPSDDTDTAPVSVVEAAGGTGGGSTAFTGFPGTGVIAWMFGLAMLGLFALALGSRRRPVEAPPSKDRRHPSTGRFLDTPEPFCFFKDEE